MIFSLTERVRGVLFAPTKSRGATHRKLRSLAFYSRPSPLLIPKKIKTLQNGRLLSFTERVRGVEPLSSPWQGLIIAAIRYPLPVCENLNSQTSNSKNSPTGRFFGICHLEFECLSVWVRQGSDLRPSGYEPRALPLSYGPGGQEGLPCAGGQN